MTEQASTEIVIEKPQEAQTLQSQEPQKAPDVTKTPEVLPAKYVEPLPAVGAEPAFNALTDAKALDHLVKVASIFSKSAMIPSAFQGNAANCFVACHQALNLKIDPLVFMQHCYVVHGKPAVEGKFAIALLEARGPYSRVRFEYEGEGDNRKCIASGERKDSGEVDECEVSVLMAKQNGWWDKKDSKWPTMTDQMLAYRAGAWLARRHCPSVLLGMQTIEEVRDVEGLDGKRQRQPRSGRKVMRKLGQTVAAQKRTREAVKGGRGYRYSQTKIVELQKQLSPQEQEDLKLLAQAEYGAIEHGEFVFTFRAVEGWADALVTKEGKDGK